MHSYTTPDISLLDFFYQALTDHGIAYCILRNADEVEQGCAHDVDMTIDAAFLEKAEQLLHAIAEQKGWKKHLQTGSSADPVNIKCYHYYQADIDLQQIHILHIDIFPTFTWKGRVLLNNKTLLTRITGNGLYRKAAEETEAVCNLFVRLLFNGYIKEKYKKNIKRVFVTKTREVFELMLQFLPQALVADINHWVHQEEWHKIERERKRIIIGIQRTAPHHRMLYFRYILGKALCRKGMVVAFLGTDGSGKSSIINELPNIIGRTFSGDTINYYHWRPGFIKTEKRLDADVNEFSNVSPHTRKSYCSLISLAKMSMYVLDYMLGYWFRIRWQAAKGHLVVFDRYYYDFYMDKARYRLNIGNWIIRLLHLFIPKPDITFVLLGDAEKIHARKNELPLEEVQRQIDLLRANKRLFASPVVVDVCRSIPEVVYTVSSNILKKLSGQKLG